MPTGDRHGVLGDARQQRPCPILHSHRFLEPFYRRYEHVSVRIGLVGNALFVLGSVLFLFGPSLAATLCWLVGSIGMLVRAVGRLYADERGEYENSPASRQAMARARLEADTAPE